MKILLDEGTPQRAQTTPHRHPDNNRTGDGWSGITNGNLLRRAEGQFDVLITSDQNWKYQQNLTGVRIAIVQLPTNQIPKVIALARAVQAALDSIQVGEF